MNRVDTIIPLGEQIITLAHQCPYIEGDAVYRARPYAEMLKDTTDYLDYDVCLQQGIFRQLQQTQINNALDKIQLIPNPASNSVEVLIGEHCNGKYFMKIIDALGNTCFKNNFDCKDKKQLINLSSLPSGVYQIEIRINESVFFTSKLVVLK